MMIICYVLLVLFLLFCLYLCYKTIWYAVKIGWLQIKLYQLQKQGYSIEKKRKIIYMFFGKKGVTDFTVEANGKKYNVHLLSFISSRGRWNIEKGALHYYAEARHYERIFFNVQHNSSYDTGLSRDFLRESGFQKCVFHLPQADVSQEDGEIILVHPVPKLLTYTEKKLEYLKSGSTLNGYTVIYLKDFAGYLETKGACDNAKQ